MLYIVVFGSIALILIVAQIRFLFFNTKDDAIINHKKEQVAYSDLTIEKSHVFFRALVNSIIKKHIITNSSDDDDTARIVNHFSPMLKSSIVCLIMSSELDRDKYNG